MPLRFGRSIGFDRLHPRLENGSRAVGFADNLRPHSTRWHIVCLVVTDLGPTAAQPQALVHGFQQTTDGFAPGGNLHLGADVGVAVDARESPIALAVEIEGDVQGALMALGAQHAAPFVDLVWMGARGAMSGMTGKCLDHILLIIMWQARVVGFEVEVDLTKQGRHGS